MSARSENEFPPQVRFAIAMTGGTLVALAAHLRLSGIGWALAGVWRELFPTSPALFRAALAWWAVAALAFAASFLIATLLHGRPALRTIIGFALLAVLAVAGRSAGAAIQPGAGAALVATVIAGALGAVMAWLGAYLAMRRVRA